LFFIFVLVAITFYSCKQEEVLPTVELEQIKEGKNVAFEEKEGRIAFGSTLDFEKAMQSKLEFPKVGNFPNAAVSSNARTAEGLDEILLEVPEKLLAKLNDDFVMQIGKWVLKLDFYKQMLNLSMKI